MKYFLSIWCLQTNPLGTFEPQWNCQRRFHQITKSSQNYLLFAWLHLRTKLKKLYLLLEHHRLLLPSRIVENQDSDEQKFISFFIIIVLDVTDINFSNILWQSWVWCKVWYRGWFIRFSCCSIFCLAHDILTIINIQWLQKIFIALIIFFFPAWKNIFPHFIRNRLFTLQYSFRHIFWTNFTRQSIQHSIYKWIKIFTGSSVNCHASLKSFTSAYCFGSIWQIFVRWLQLSLSFTFSEIEKAVSLNLLTSLSFVNFKSMFSICFDTFSSVSCLRSSFLHAVFVFVCSSFN